MTKKLIEVAIPLEQINDGCAQEKNPFLKGHPRSMHLWWARRPLAAARAILFAQLVDDPSSHPELFPTEVEQNNERKRLFELITQMTKWENINNQEIMSEAREEIYKYWRKTCEALDDHSELYDPDRIPAIHDPFAGGGAIPLEAQRLGLESYASDLNPVAVMINKGLTEIPSLFDNVNPVNPESRRLLTAGKAWEGAAGLSEDVTYYGEVLKTLAEKKIGHLYPRVRLPKQYGDSNAQVIAWIWTRTTKCSNPACGMQMPLASTFVLSKKKGHEAWIEPYQEHGQLKFKIHRNKCPKERETLKMGKSALFKCPFCGEVTTDAYVKEQGKKNNISTQLMAIVAKGSGGGRIYIEPDEEQQLAANIEKPSDYPDGTMPNNPRWFSPPAFGMENYSDLFTNRQLIALTTFSDLLSTVRVVVESDAVAAGMNNDHIGLKDGGNGAKAYAEAVSIYLAFGISQLTRYSCTLCGWNVTNENVAQAFGRQALPMVWDFAEANTIEGSLSITSTISWPANVIKSLGPRGHAYQSTAQLQKITKGKIVSTDPPYYDNIGYADLSDFFYIWLRRSLKDVYPELFSTMMVPKAEELVATPYRHGGKEAAEKFFLDGMTEAMSNIARQSHPNYPVTIYYAFKQSDKKSDEGVSSTGWETFLGAVISAGFVITGTWPIRTERTKGLKGSVNALASSIVLVCRKRENNAQVCTRRSFINLLHKELRPAIKKLQQANIAPVDLAQSAIGPGIGVFSRFSKVLEADGSEMTVSSALQLINQELDLYLNEQDSVLDRDSRFCVDLYTQIAFNRIPFGEADTLARAKNTSVASMVSCGILFAQKGLAHLVDREGIPDRISEDSSIWLLCQQLTRAMEKGGIEECAKVVAPMYGSAAEYAKDLAYRLYTIAERKGWSQEAYAYNALVVSWPEIQSRAAALQARVPKQMSIFDYNNQ